MAFLHAGKSLIKRMLSVVGVRLDSLTAERFERDRLRDLERSGHFDKPICPVLRQFKQCEPASIFEQIRRDEPRFAELLKAGHPDTFPLGNDYYKTPDAEVLYAVVQLYRPSRIIEIGSGYSTQLFRLASNATGNKTHITSIDPQPRQDVRGFSDHVIEREVEKLSDLAVFQTLDRSDILFIDSSHQIKPGNDVLHLLFNVLPNLQPGVLVHFHDIFLPYEYPRHWILEHRYDWTEQYLIQAFLTGNESLEVLWPGYYLQRAMPDFAKYFRHWNHSTAQNLWLRTAPNKEDM